VNLDIVVPVPHHPAPGETVLGGDHFTQGERAPTRPSPRRAWAGRSSYRPRRTCLSTARLHWWQRATIGLHQRSACPHREAEFATVSVPKTRIALIPPALAHTR